MHSCDCVSTSSTWSGPSIQSMLFRRLRRRLLQALSASLLPSSKPSLSPSPLLELVLAGGGGVRHFCLFSLSHLRPSFKVDREKAATAVKNIPGNVSLQVASFLAKALVIFCILRTFRAHPILIRCHSRGRGSSVTLRRSRKPYLPVDQVSGNFLSR